MQFINYKFYYCATFLLVVIVMYRKYLQSLSEQSVCTQSTAEMNRKSTIPSPIAEEDENEVSTDTDSEFPEQHSLIEEASRSAAKAIISYENISFSSSEESLCSSPRTFDPGGSGSRESEKKIVPTSFFLDEYIERECTPVFKKPANDIRIEDSTETIVQEEFLSSSSDLDEDDSDIESEIIKEQPKPMNHIRFKEPQCSQISSVINKDESTEPNKTPPMKVWGPNGITRNNHEILLVKPIEECVNTPIEKLLYNSFTMTNNSVPTFSTNNSSNNEVIKVLPINGKNVNHNNNNINNIRFRNSVNHKPIVNNYRSFNHTGRNSTRRKVTRVSSQRVKFHDEIVSDGQLANSHSAATNLQWRSRNSQTQVNSGWSLSPICCGLSTSRR